MNGTPAAHDPAGGTPAALPLRDAERTSAAAVDRARPEDVRPIRRAAVLGATGGIGHAVARQLIQRGAHVVVTGRRPAELDALASLGAEVRPFDPFDLGSVAEECSGAEAVFHCLNLPYPRWHDLPRIWINVISAASRAGAVLAVPGDVYVYGPPPAAAAAAVPDPSSPPPASSDVRGAPRHDGPPAPQPGRVDETYPWRPQTRKGALRARLERMALDAHHQGRLRLALARFPDFYGPGVTNGVVTPMYRAALSGRPIPWPGDPAALHEWIFVEDAAGALIFLAERPASHGEAYHIPGPEALTGYAFAALLREVASRLPGQAGPPASPAPPGHPSAESPGRRPVRALAPWQVRAAGLFDPEAREFAEMMYLFETPLLLDGSRFVRTFGRPYPATPYAEGILQTLRWAARHPPARKG